MDTNQSNIANNEDKQKSNITNENKPISRTTLRLTLRDVSNLAVLKYGGVNAFGRALGINKSTASQVLSGAYIPVKAETIHKIADALNIDAVTLSQIYADHKEGKNAK